MRCTVDKQRVPVYFAVVICLAEIVYFWHFFFFFSLLSSLWVLSACFCSLPLCASLEVHSARVSVMQQCFLVHVNHCQVFSFLCIFYCTCCFNKAVSHEKPSVRGFTTGMRCSVDFLFAAKISKQHSSLQCTFLWLSVLFKYINAISKTNFKGLSECFQLFLVCILDQKLLTNFEFWNGRMTVFSRETYANKHRGKKKNCFFGGGCQYLTEPMADIYTYIYT